MEWLMVPNPWYIGNSAQNQKESSDQLRWPFGLENLTRISKKNKIGMSKSQNLSPLKYTSFLGPLLCSQVGENGIQIDLNKLK